MTPRSFPRIEFVEPVRLSTGQSTLELMALNLSRGGIRLETNRPLPMGTRVSLSFETEAGPIAVAVAEVVWRKPFEPISIDGELPGMAVRFLKMDALDRDRLVDFLQNAAPDDVLHVSADIIDDFPEPEVVALPPATPPETPAPRDPRWSGTPAPSPFDTESDLSFADELHEELDLETPPGTPRPTPQILIPDPQRRSRGLPFRTVSILTGAVLLLAAAGVTVGVWMGRRSDRRAQATPTVPIPTASAALPTATVAATAAPNATPAATATVRLAQPVVTLAVAASPVARPTAAPVSTPAATRAPIATRPPVPKLKPAADADAAIARVTSAAGLTTLDVRNPSEGRYKYFTLTNPPRFVLDVVGVREVEGLPATGVGSIHGIRTGRHPGYTRLVLDFQGTEVPPFEVVETPTGVQVVFQ